MLERSPHMLNRADVVTGLHWAPKFLDYIPSRIESGCVTKLSLLWRIYGCLKV